MKKFVFRLETLLRIRRMKEEEAQANVSQAIRLYQQEAALLMQMEDKRRRLVCEFHQLQNQIQHVELLKNYYFYFDKLNGDITAQQMQVEAAEENRDACIRALDEAVKNRKVVEKLKDRQRAEYEAELLRQEQNVLDELGLQAFLRNK